MRTASSMRSTPRPVISGGELGLRERQRHEADRAEVVDLVGLDLLDRGDERRQVAQVAVDELERRRLVDDHLALRVVLAPDQAEHLVALAGEELGEVAAVLAGDAGDEGAFHDGKVLRSVTVDPVPARLELVEELVAALLFVGLADRGRGARAGRRARGGSPRLVSCSQRT